MLRRFAYRMSLRIQAEKCPSPTVASGGTLAAQASIALGQRVRNTQPEGGFIGLGMSPSRMILSRLSEDPALADEVLAQTRAWIDAP